MPKTVAVISGGYSGEAAVSLKSAQMIMDNIDRNLYHPVSVVIDREQWVAHTDAGPVAVDRNEFSWQNGAGRVRPDLCMVMIHGTPGEDGLLQGYFDMIGMPYTTGGVMNTALTFNKVFTTRLLKQMGFNAAGGVLLRNPSELDAEYVAKTLKFPLFVKPNEGGSSLGVSKVKQIEEISAAVDLAYSKGSAILIEEFLSGREVTCGVLCENGVYKALAITEIKTKKEFFDYAAKYTYDQTEEITPAELPEHLYKRCQEISEKVAAAFHCRGVVRIDYKLDGETFSVIEINTVPGMTEFSIVPQQAAALGIGKTELITRIIKSTCE
jgi:D-alanine-D-alanine ligase